MKVPEAYNMPGSKYLPGYFQHSDQFCYLVTDEEGQILFANSCFQKKINSTGNDLAGTAITNIILVAEKENCRQVIHQCLSDPGAIQAIDLHLSLLHNSYSLIRWDVSAWANEEGEIENLQWLGINVDEIKGHVKITGDKAGTLIERYKNYEQTLEGLWLLELRIPIATAASPEEILQQCKLYGFIADCNDNLAQMYGYEKADELIGASLSDFVDYDDPIRREYLKKFIREGFTSLRVETKEFDRYGKTLYFLNNMTGIIENGFLMKIWGSQQDITEQRKAEEQLRFQASVYNNISDAVTTSDMDLFVTSWNKGAEEIYGVTATEIVGKKISDLLRMNYRNTTREEVINTVFENNIWEGEVSFTRRSDQTERTILATLTLQQNEFKQPVGIIAVNKDITERKKTEDILRYQTAILNNVSDLIMILNFDMTILSWNKKAAEITGYSAEEATGKFLGDIVRPDYGNITASQAAKELDEKGFWQGEISFLNKYGVRKYILHTSSHLLNETGQRIAIIGTGKCITQSKEAEEQLRQSELFYRNLIAHSLDGVMITDENGIVRFASPSITEILGYNVEETIGKLTFDYAHPEDRALSVSAFLDEVAGAPRQKFIRVRLQKKTGEYIWCIVRGHNLMQNPYVQGIMLYFYDDTLRKQAEDALIESEKRLRNQAVILTNVNDIIVATDLELNISSWNKVAEELSGMMAEEVIGKPYRDIIPLDYSPYTRNEVADIVFANGIWRGEISFVNKRGEKKQILHTLSLLQDENGKAIGILGVGKDITERKKIEARLQESELFYRNMISNSLDGIVMVNLYGQITYCSPSVTNLSGYETHEITGHNLFEFVHPDDRAAAEQAYVLEMNKQSVIYYILLRLKHSNGSWIWCSVRGHNLFSNPAVNAMVIYFTDETKRKETEDRLRQSEQRFRQLIHNLNLGVLLMNEKGEVLVCNKPAAELVGITEKELTGLPIIGLDWDVIYEDGSKFSSYDYPVAVAIRTKKSVRDVVMGVRRAGNNERVWLLVNAEVVMDNNDNVLYSICSYTDITEQKFLSGKLIEQEVQKQKQLMQATIDGQEKERKEIGRELHDNISQHITITRLYLEVAREKADGELLKMINLAHKGLLDTVAEIRQLSQSLVPPSLSDIGLVESIRDIFVPLRNTHAFKIDFQYHQFNEALLPENMKLMLFRIIQEQINNIIRHAQADTIHISLQTSEGQVILSVADNGKGFDPGSVKRGLGFDNISSRADLFGGKLRIEAARGKGCLIRVTIPLQ